MTKTASMRPVGWVVQGVATLLLAMSVVVASGQGAAAATAPGLPSEPGSSTQGRSTFCHLTDGSFGVCPGGGLEWSDIHPQAFPDRHAFLYADQGITAAGATRPDTFFLNYDECDRTTPLPSDEYFLVSFDTVEGNPGSESLLRYAIHIFGDGTIVEFENGVAQQDSSGHTRVHTIDNQLGSAGFGTSPMCNFNHLVVEYQIDLSAAGSHSYSPDPIFWGGTEPPCTVAITKTGPPDDPMNVAQQASFSATVSGGGSPVTYQWSVDGNVLKEYSENASAPFSITPMAVGDFQNPTLQFYWLPDPSQIDPNNGGPVARHVHLTVTAGTQTCSDDQSYSVERNNTNPARDAEFFYTANHSNAVDVEHAAWHSGHMFDVSGYSGSQFFEFHRAFIANFNAFRATFGYPPIGPNYDPSTPIPSGVDIDHAGRTGSNPPNCTSTGVPGSSLTTCATPTEFTPTGTTPHVSNGDPCDPLINPEPQKIQDFPADQNLLGCAVTDPWHNIVHMAIGGDMSSPATSAKDPIFWRWHGFVNAVSLLRSTFTPPIISYESPARFSPFITSLATLQVTFDKAVNGVAAGDLAIDGSPATAVTGSGAGPYVFSGFAAPSLGTVTATLSPGAIVGASNGEATLAASWNYVLLDPTATVPGDTLTVAQKIALNLDPTRADTFRDGVPDGFKLSHACLIPFLAENVDAPMDMQGHTGPAVLSPNGDGHTIHADFTAGLDPCSALGQIGLHAVRTGFDGATLTANDDGSTSAVNLPFPINFFGDTPTQTFINNNGNLTFGQALSTFTPFAITGTTQTPIIAPFFADVDTTNAGSGLLAYGSGFADGHPAFGATWPGVGCFGNSTGLANTFQVVLVDRSDTGSGNFDIEFNYDVVQWETGTASGGNAQCQGGNSARAGFSNGSGVTGTFFQLPGSGVNGAFLDSNPTGLIHQDHNSPVLGRYVYPVRNGAVSITNDQDHDGVPDALDNCPSVANPDQRDANLDGIGDACETTSTVHSTAAFLEANLDGTSSVLPAADTHASADPSLLTILTQIVNFRVAAGLTTDRGQLISNLVNSVVASGLISADQQGPLEVSVQAATGGLLPPPGDQGYWLGSRDGGVFAFANAVFHGSAAGSRLNAPCVGIAAAPNGQGYWLAGSDGGVFNYGRAGFFGSAGGSRLNAPVVGIAPAPDGQGYWLAAADGGVFNYGHAGFFGSLGGSRLNAPVVGIAAAPDGQGYWLVASDGGVFAFGSARFHGSVAGVRLNRPVVGMAATPDGQGYWLVASDGGLFALGAAGFFGSGTSIRFNRPIVGIAPTPDGLGYWLAGADGSAFALGDARFTGSVASSPLNQPVTGIAPLSRPLA